MIYFRFERWLDKILIDIFVYFMQSQAKLESEIAKLKEQNEKTKEEGNSLQEKLQMQVRIDVSWSQSLIEQFVDICNIH